MILDGPKLEQGRLNQTSSTFHETQAVSLCSFTLLSVLSSTHFATSFGHDKGKIPNMVLISVRRICSMMQLHPTSFTWYMTQRNVSNIAISQEQRVIPKHFIFSYIKDLHSRMLHNTDIDVIQCLHAITFSIRLTRHKNLLTLLSLPSLL